MVVQLRICVPGELSAVTLKTCREQRGAAEVALVPGASVVPQGDVIEVLIAGSRWRNCSRSWKS